MTANNSDALVRQSQPSTELQRSDDAWIDALAGLGTAEQLDAIRRSFRQANSHAFPVNLRFSLPWQGDRVYVTVVLYIGHRPRRFTRHASRLRAIDPFLMSFWHQIPARILASLTPEQGEVIDRALKPYRWQRHPWDWRGTVPWGDRLYAFTLVAGPERRSRERRLAERDKHPLWTSANAAFVLALQLPFVLTIGLGVGTLFLHPHSLSASSERAYQQAIDASLLDPIARDAYFTSDLPRLRDRLSELGLEAAIRDRHPRRLSDREYEQLVIRAFHQRLTPEHSSKR
ncbi:MAG: hypothetical protein AAFX40_05610 [Cyanobacteria bacterium J06639_1]